MLSQAKENDSVGPVENQPGMREWLVVLRPLRAFADKYIISNCCLYAATILFSLDPLALRFLIDKGLIGHNASAIVVSLVTLLSIYGLRVVALSIGNVTAAGVAQRLMFEIRRNLLRKLLASPAAFYEPRGVGDLMMLLNSDVERVGAIITDRLPTLVGSAVGGVVILGIMLTLQWKLACLAFPAIPLFLFLRIRFRRNMEIVAETSRQAVGVQASFSNEMLKGIFQIQLLGAEAVFEHRYIRLAILSLRSLLRQRRLEILYGMVSIAALGAISTTVLGVGAALSWHGALTIGGFVAFYSYLIRLLDPIHNMIQSYADLKLSQPSLRRIWEVASATKVGRLRYLTTAAPRATEIVCANIAFGYGDGRTILGGVDLTVAAGQMVALMGPSGSGKSTLAKLMVGCHPLRTGVIRCNGTDICDMSVEELRRNVTLVPQDGVLFSGTVRENAVLGHRSCSDDHLQRLAHISCFDEVVSRLPQRWSQQLGPNGDGLSGGERQRLMILRALVQGCPVLILDEATSSLDPDLEARILERLSTYTQERAVLIITHREAPARWADETLRLDFTGRLTQPGRQQTSRVDRRSSGHSVVATAEP
jgi:ABC-type bacteriocin/lantibiotic exporter with double-glycine peptidase domain